MFPLYGPPPYILFWMQQHTSTTNRFLYINNAQTKFSFTGNHAGFGHMLESLQSHNCYLLPERVTLYYRPNPIKWGGNYMYHLLEHNKNSAVYQHNMFRNPAVRKSRDSSVGLDGHGSNPSSCRRFFPSPEGPDRPWSPPSPLYNGYRGLFPRM
jgi:hypothetical protein